jgi:taurine dioxygenase
VHPICLRHPNTGRSQLFGVAGTAAGIEGLSDEGATRLLLELKAHATASAFTWSTIVQRQTLLIWDNLRLLHTATPVRYSDAEGERRHLLRVSVGAPSGPRT